MEAMFVSPAPPSNGKPSPTTKNSSKGSETGFAPKLNEALNEKNSSPAQQSESGKNQRTGQTDTPEKENNTPHLKEHPDSPENVAANGAAESKHTPLSRQHVSTNFLQGNRNAASAEFSGVDAQQKIIEKNSAENLAKLLNGSQVQSKDFRQQSSLKSTEHSTTSLLNHHSTASSPEDETVRGLRGVTAAAGRQANNSLFGKQGSAIQLQANDSITVSHSSSQATPLSNQKFTPTSILVAAALRGTEGGKQAGNNGNVLSEYATQSPGHPNSNHNSLPLSAEKIAARITDMPFQQNLGNTSLREANQSIRHDWLGEFIEAKVDQFQGKSNGKIDQQLLNSEGEMSAHNPSGTQVKGGEKGGETPFSQTLQLAGADKQVSSGVEMQRPGAMNNIMLSQLQENDILHQVINKMRLSQHTQDSKMVMKLHPAELGNLKIDIHLKEGIISANILAQSQQAQEILERNMGRLRALMEEQGLKVNEIAISLDSDPTEQKNLFEEHLAQDNKGFADTSKNSSGKEFVVQADDTEVVEVVPTPLQSGVNVLI